MEATSARMARDRFGGFAEPATTPLQRYIQNACDPQNFQPNIALNMEIVDLINSKKGSAPREAAIAIVTHVNHRNPNISLLALTLLDNCVKNCGYPFHLQISTKEFLNELVRRFPERPPIRYSRVQSKILELIEEWRQTICQTSKYKEDLGFVRDMHRLLNYKGYMFPEVRQEDAAVLNQSDTLQSAEQMEEEERAAQSAKLQELIRRGTPHDLQEANKLMKVMAGYDTRHKTDYRAKAAEEVGKVQQKARILEEMLQEYKPGDDLTGEAWEELGNALASAQPKIQRMCEEESDDTEAVAKLFEINDSIHRTLERYRLIKKGDLEGASKIPKGTLGVSGAGVRQGAGNELSLIDFGGPEEQITGSGGLQDDPSVQASTSNGGSLENDLLGLSMSDGGPSISLGGPTTYTQAPPQRKTNADILSAFGSGPTAPNPSIAPRISAAPLPSFKSTSNPLTSTSHIAQPSPDPFGALSSARQGSPLPAAQGTRPAPASGTLLDLGSAPTSSNASGHTPSTSIDDDWTFSSALPNDAHEITVTNSSVNVVFLVTKQVQPDGSVLVNSSISNNTTQLISDLRFQVAVMKGYSLSLQPQSGRNLQPRQRGGITQIIKVNGYQPGSGNSIRIRWKASYSLGGQRQEEQGEVPSLGLT